MAVIILEGVSRTLWKVSLLLLAGTLYYYGIGSLGLVGPDEPRYAFIGREMARSADWVTPRLWDGPWFEKPALLYWLIGGAYRLGWSDDVAPRFGVVTVSLLFLVFYFVQLRREFGERAALFATALLATSAGWLAFSQIGVTDLPMAAFFSASLVLALRWVRSGGRRGLLLAGVLLGAAMLAKGLVPLVLIAPLILGAGRRRWPDLAVFAAGAIAAAAPWYWLCYARNGWPFIEEFFIKHHFSRFSSGELQHIQPWWFYFPVLAGAMFPWTPLIGVLFTRRFPFHDRRQRVLLGVLLWGGLFFSASTNKLPGYLLPLLPAAAALIGIRLAEPARPAGAMWIAACAALLAIVPLVPQVLPQALLSGLSHASIDWVWWGLLPAGAVALAAWWLAARRDALLSAAALVALSVAIAVFYLKITTYPVLERIVTARPLWAEIQRSGQTVCLEPEVHRAWIYGLNFYAAGAIPVCDLDCGLVLRPGEESNRPVLESCPEP